MSLPRQRKLRTKMIAGASLALLMFIVLAMRFVYGPDYKTGGQKPQTIDTVDYDKGLLSYPLLWEHVYNPERLHIIDQSVTVSGVIISIHPEPDGDFHIQFKPDSETPLLTNSMNIKEQGGYLVLEIICAHDDIQKDAVSSCLNYTNMVRTPAIGEHCTVQGPHVTDQVHGWNEIHPVASITLF